MTEKAKEERKSDIYSKLIGYPPPHDTAAQTSPQYAFKRILLTKNKTAYNSEDKMSLYHAREYFTNAIYTFDICKCFFMQKRDVLVDGEGKTDKPTPKILQENVSKIRLESLVNLVCLLSNLRFTFHWC